MPPKFIAGDLVWSFKVSNVLLDGGPPCSAGVTIQVICGFILETSHHINKLPRAPDDPIFQRGEEARKTSDICLNKATH